VFNFFKKQAKGPQAGFDMLGTDLHSHLLPGIDDGAPDLATSLELIQNLIDLGFKRIITTPHVYHDLYPNTRDIILQKRDEVLQAIDNEKLALESFSAAAEYFIDEHFVERLHKEPLLTLPDNRVLVEMSFFQPFPGFHKVIFDLQMKGYRPVLAHPERYTYFQKLEDFQHLKDIGCQLQVNLLSLVGYYGSPIKSAALKITNHQLHDFLATDLHHAQQARLLQQSSNHDNIIKALIVNEL
jgi:tyrosine-protein phosphatase YwqE